jgi:cytidylate kinase
VIGGLAGSLPQALYLGLTQNGVPAASADAVAHLPPTSALFGAFLGYNPIGVLLPAEVQQQLAPSDLSALLSKTFFPNLIAGPFLVGLRTVFYVGAAMCALGAVASALRGQRHVAAAAAPTRAVEPRPIAGRQVRVVTISRQYGSGGGEVGARLAHRLGWELLDHAVVQRVAAALNLTQAEAEAGDERSLSFVSSLVHGARSLDPSLLDDQPLGLADMETYCRTVRSVIESAASIGHVIIIGRGGQVLLAGRPDVLHVRLVAPLEQRIAYVAYREGLDQAAARRRLVAKDNDRERYLQVAHGRRTDDPCLYDLIINTGGVDLDSVVDEIRLALERKGRHRTAGPPAGVAPYPAEPRDFRAVTATAV